VPACCTPGPHSIDTISGPAITNPVAAALRLPVALRRSGGFLAAIGAAARRTQHDLQAAWRDGAKRLTAAASSVRSGLQQLAAWAASGDRGQQPGQALRSDQVSVAACTLTALHPCSWDDPAVLSVLWSDVLSGLASVLPVCLSDWWSVLVQYCITNCNFLILLISSLICAEFVFRLVWRVTGCGQELADAYALITASPTVRRMALAFSAVPVRSRPTAQALAYRSGSAAPAFDTRLALSHIPSAGAGHSVRYCPGYGPACNHRRLCSTAGAGVRHGAISPGASSAACLLGGARPGAAWSRHFRLWSPGPILAEMGLGGGSYCAVPHRHDLEQLGAAWREIADFLELEGAAFDRSQWSTVTAVTSPGAEAPLLVPPRPGHISIFPTYSTIPHSSLAEDRRLLQTLRSSAALEALDQTYQHPLLPIVNPVLAAQQLCQHGGYPQVSAQ
jgi:hypothetical protein